MKSWLPHCIWALVAASAFGGGWFLRKPVDFVPVERRTVLGGEATQSDGSLLGKPSKGAKSASKASWDEGSADLFLAENGDLSAQQRERLSKTAFQHPSILKRSLAFHELLEDLTPENAEEMYAKMREGRVSGEQWTTFLYAWGQKDPAGAMDSLSQNGRGIRSRGMGSVLSGWASQSPLEAQQWVEQLEANGEDIPGSLLNGLIHGLADSEPEMAMRKVEEIQASGGSRDIDRLARSVVKEMVIAKGLDSAIAFTSGMTDGPVKGEALESIADRYVKEDPDRAAQWALQFEGTEYGGQVMREVGDEWAEKDPESAVSWLEKIGNEDVQRHGMVAAFRQWSENDPVRASEKLTEMPDSTAKDYAVSGLARSIVREDPEAAILWAGQIGNESLRKSVLTRTGQDWLRRNRNAATEWISSSGLPEDIQKSIFRGNRGG